MIETTNPEFDVDKLRQRVRSEARVKNHASADELIGIFRAEIAKRGPAPLEAAPPSPSQPPVPPPRSSAEILPLPDVPVVNWWRTVDPKTQPLKDLLRRGIKNSAGSR